MILTLFYYFSGAKVREVSTLPRKQSNQQTPDSGMSQVGQKRDIITDSHSPSQAFGPPQHFRQLGGKSVTFHPGSPVAHELRTASIAPRYTSNPGAGRVGLRSPPQQLRNPHNNPYATVGPKVPVGQLPMRAGGIQVLPPQVNIHSRLPAVNIPLMSAAAGSGGEESEDSDLSAELSKGGLIVYGSTSDQGHVRTSNV